MNAYFYDNLANTDYAAVRLALADRAVDQDDTQLEETLLAMFPEADPEDVENFMRGLHSFGKQLAPVARTVVPLAQRALPGALQGAMQGGMVAGPWGALAGALGGGAMSLLSSPAGAAGGPAAPSQTPPGVAPAAPPPGVSPAVAAPVATPGGAGMQPSYPPQTVPAGSQPAVAQLLALLARPETMQALQALLMGTAGQRSVQVGQRQVPATAFANAIAELATGAVDAGFVESNDDYLYDAAGAPRCDVANPAEHARLMLADLAVVADQEAAEWADDEDAYEDDDAVPAYYVEHGYYEEDYA